MNKNNFTIPCLILTIVILAISLILAGSRFKNAYEKGYTDAYRVVYQKGYIEGQLHQNELWGQAIKYYPLCK